MTINHLTPAELDALLEAARAASSSPWHYLSSGGFIVGPGHYSAIAQTWSKSEEDFENAEANGKLIALANPATITRLVLMVRAQDTIWRTAVKERDAAADALGKHYEELETRAVEDFRTRAVRAIEEELDMLRGQTATLDGLARAGCEGRDSCVAGLVRLIESLPLVETRRRSDGYTRALSLWSNC